MLILLRKKFERIIVGDDVVITVMEIGKERISIGISAPKWMPIDGAGIYLRNCQQRPKLRAPDRPRKSRADFESSRNR
ncbi:carbon storage regulator [Pseudomonas sp. Pseusp122]|uniref:carbon storage regulator n=1 Tax=unclassified Pseudomonas TaxID=196821 RepID=UPI0039A76E64